MSNHIVFQIIQDLDIKDENNVRHRIAKIDRTDIDHLLDKMDAWYQSRSVQLTQKTIGSSTLFDIWVPATPVETINRLSANLIFADTVTLADPLYDYLCVLSFGNIYGKKLFSEMAEKDEYLCDHCAGRMDEVAEEIAKDRLVKILTFYLRSKPLIDSGLLIPYVDISSKAWPILDAPLGEILKKYDEDVDRLIYLGKRNKRQIEKLIKENRHAVNSATLPYIYEGIGMEYDKFLGLIGVGEIFSNKFVPSPSIDFMDHISGGVFRALYGVLQKKIEIDAKYVPPTNQSHLILPTLAGIPIQEIPEILYKEKDSIAQFKEFLVSKITTISSPIGIPEWEKEVEGIRTGLRHELVELDRTLTHIKKDHLKRQTANVFTLVFSIGLASLALLQQTINPTLVIQTVASGAGLASSAGSIIKSWIDYRKDVEDQKRRDVYFLWRLRSHD